MYRYGMIDAHTFVKIQNLIAYNENVSKEEYDLIYKLLLPFLDGSLPHQ